MTLAQLIPLTIQASMALLIFSVGLGARLEDLTYLLRRPRLLLRSLVAMNVIMPLLAVALALLFDLNPILEWRWSRMRWPPCRRSCRRRSSRPAESLRTSSACSRSSRWWPSSTCRWPRGYRVPCAIRWPGVIKPGTVLNDIFAHEDMLPTLVAAAGDGDVNEKLKKGMKVGDKQFKVHLDGYDITDSLLGKSPSPRREFFYFNDDGTLVAVRVDQWKLHFAEQRAHGMEVWEAPFVTLRFPKLFNLRSDPFETADHEGMDHRRWRVEHAFVLVPAQQFVGKFLESFKEFPPSQKGGSFSIDGVLEALQRGTSGGN